jgi:pimeloyl-ACP methyl ester carboxylesterase
MEISHDGRVFYTDDDASIAYLEEGSGQPIIFIHGFTLDLTLWQCVMKSPPAGCRVILYDLRGHGASSSRPPDFSKARLLADLEAVVTETGSTDPIVCAHSLGCTVAVEYALHHPEHTRAVVLVSPYISGFTRPKESIWSHDAPSFSMIAKIQGIDEAKRRWNNFGLFDPVRASPVAAKLMHDMICRFSGVPWVHQTDEEPAAPTTCERLSDLQCPMLVIAGSEDDILYRQVADFLHSVVPRSSLVMIRNAGHLVPIEQPRAFCDALSMFVASLDRMYP